MFFVSDNTYNNFMKNFILIISKFDKNLGISQPQTVSRNIYIIINNMTNAAWKTDIMQNKTILLRSVQDICLECGFYTGSLVERFRLA